MLTIQETNYQLLIFAGPDPLDPQDDNVDVEVVFPNGERYVATFFTLKNLETIMIRHAQSGECNYGKYLWAADMIIVHELTSDAIRETVAYIVRERELESAFSHVVEVEATPSDQ